MDKSVELQSTPLGQTYLIRSSNTVTIIPTRRGLDMVYLVEIYSSRGNMLSRWRMSSAGKEAGQRRESLDLFSFTRHGAALVRTRCCPPGRACVQAAEVLHCNLHTVQRQRAGAPSRSGLQAVPAMERSTPAGGMASMLSRRWRCPRRGNGWRSQCAPAGTADRTGAAGAPCRDLREREGP
jgi:hypothetical protein